MSIAAQVIQRFLALTCPEAAWNEINPCEISVTMPDGRAHVYGINLRGDIYEGATIIARANHQNADGFHRFVMPDSWTIEREGFP